jgi:CBS domain-containing protein
MKAQDIMTRDVVTVRPNASVQDIAKLMVEKHISGIPVVNDDGAVIGMVSQTDLMHRAEVGTEPKRKWWFRAFADANTLARDFVKAHGHAAHDIMARQIVSVRPDAELRDVADIMDKYKVKRVPVVQDGKLVGVVTRGDLVRALSLSQIVKSDKKVDNAALHKTLKDRLHKHAWVNESFINLVVEDGVVEMWGYVESADQKRALRVLIEETEGVAKVVDKVSIGTPYRGGV